MAGGFFLGGVAEGMGEAEKRAMERDRLAQELALRTRALDITQQSNLHGQGIAERAQTLSEKNSAREAARQGQAVVDKHIADTMSVVSETVKNGVAAGRDPEIIRKAVAPLVDSAMKLAPRAGRDPAALGAQVDALLTGPTTIESTAASAQGAAQGAARGRIAAAKEYKAAGVEDPSENFKTVDEKVKAENSLRDDYLKQAQPFIQIRDAKNRLDNIEKTGAGDMALIFQYMKILDPGSTVREGEFATAKNAAGVPQAIQAQYNKLIGGGILGEGARSQIISQANKIYQASAVQHDKNTTQFANIAKRQKLDPDNVVVDLKPANSDIISGTTPGGLNFKVRK